MIKVKTLVAAGCLCAAMAMSSTAFAMPGATSLVTVESRAEEINEEEAKEEAKDKADQEEASVKTASDKEEESAKTADGAKKAEEEEPSPYDDIAVSTVNGDDDYVNVRDEASTDGEILGKPADEEELLLRIGALLRRAQAIHTRRLTVGNTTLIYDDLSVAWEGHVTELPRKEFQLLYKLLSCPDKTFTRRQLMDEIWDLATDSDEHTVNVHINRLRDRFRDNRDFAIVTVRGLGYRMEG